MTVVDGDILRTTCNFTISSGQLYQNVFHHQRTGVGILSDAAHVTALDDWATAMYGELVDHVATGVVSNLCSVDKVAWVVDEWAVVEAIGTFVLTFTPVGTANNMPNQVSPYVIFKTARPKTVGRKFLFPMDEESFAFGLLNAATVADIVDWTDDALNNIEVAVLNYLVPGVPRTGIDAWHEFTVAIVGDIAGTQRRRRIGVGV